MRTKRIYRSSIIRCGFVDLSIVILSLLGILLLVCITLKLIPEDPRKTKIDNLAKEYSLAQNEIVSNLVSGAPQDTETMNKQHKAVEDAFMRLREAAQDTPREFVSEEIMVIVR